jgi:hypothetical protein
MPIVQILLASRSGPPPTATYEMTAAANNVNEGASLTFTVNTTNVSDGTSLYWTTSNNFDGVSRMDNPTGSFAVYSNTGSFSITVSADNTTASGQQTYSVFLYYGGPGGSGGTFATSVENIVVNDTSQSPQPPFSLSFPSGTPYMTVQNTQSDWNLGTTYTIEFWSKATTASTNGPRVILSQFSGSNQIDLGYTYKHLLFNGSEPSYQEPTLVGVPDSVYNWNGGGGWNQGYYTNVAATGGTGTGLTVNVAAGGGGYINITAITISNPGSGYTNGDVVTINNENNISGQFTIGVPVPVWTHVAFVGDGTGKVNLYYNGVFQTYFNSAGLTDGSKDLVIGRRGPDGPFQYFYGKLAMIRISNQVKYASTFIPSVSYGVEADTKLMLGSTTPTVDSTGTHPISNHGAVISTDFPRLQSLEFVENQGDYLEVAASSDFNLGTTWTIEFWLKANAASQTAYGGIWGLLNQVGWSTTNNIVVALSDNKLVFLSVAESANADVRYTEPTVGQWTHVAIVNNAGTQRVWYNGVEQTKVSGTFGTANYTNGTYPLRIGRLGPQNGGTLNGKMANIRISNTAKYLTAFTPETSYGVESDTKLFLGLYSPTVDGKGHVVINNGVAVGSDFPT